MNKNFTNLVAFWVVAQAAVTLGRNFGDQFVVDFRSLVFFLGFLSALPWIIRPLVFDNKLWLKVRSLQAWGYGLFIAAIWISVQALVSAMFGWLFGAGLIDLTPGGVLSNFTSGWWLACGICLAVLYKRKNALFALLWLAIYQVAWTAIQISFTPSLPFGTIDLFTGRDGLQTALLSGLAIAVAEWLITRTEQPLHVPISRGY
jgi:hypothetical protein